MESFNISNKALIRKLESLWIRIRKERNNMFKEKPYLISWEIRNIKHIFEALFRKISFCLIPEFS